MLSHTTKIAVYLVTMAAAEYPGQDLCNFSVPKEESEDMVDRSLYELPDQKITPFNSTQFEEAIDYFLLLRPGNITISGFRNLNRDGAIRSYCEYEKSIFEVGIRSTTSVGLDIPFEYCGTKVGSVRVETKMIKFLFTFQVSEYEGKGILQIIDVVPEWSQPTQVFLEGVSGIMPIIASVLGRVLAPLYEESFIFTVCEALKEMMNNE